MKQNANSDEKKNQEYNIDSKVWSCVSANKSSRVELALQ